MNPWDERWRVDDGTPAFGVAVVRDTPDPRLRDRVADVDVTDTAENAKRRAALMAAAPELYVAIKELLSIVRIPSGPQPTLEGVVRAAGDALRKARGEP